MFFALSAATSASIAAPALSAIPIAAAIAVGMIEPSANGASSMNQTPSPEPSSTLAPTCSDVRVLPTPPDPTMVTTRCFFSSDSISATSASRPTNDVSCNGKLFGSTSSERSAGNSVRSPRATS